MQRIDTRTTLVGAIAAGALMVACAAAPAHAQSGYGEGYGGGYSGNTRRRAPDRRGAWMERQAQHEANNDRLSGRRSLEFGLSAIGQTAYGDAPAHKALRADWGDLFRDGLGVQWQAKRHYAQNRWFSIAPMGTFQYIEHGGDSAGFLTTRSLRLHRLMGGGQLRLQPGSPLRKARFSIGLSAQAGLAHFESVGGYWGNAPVSVYKDSVVFTFEAQARAALTFRASNFVRWGLEAWVGYNWTGAPQDGSSNSAIGWQSASPDPLRSITYGGGITIEVLWGAGKAAQDRAAFENAVGGGRGRY